MKSRFLLLFISFCLSISLVAQDHEIDRNQSDDTGSTGFSSLTEAGTIAQEIIRIADKKTNFELREGGVPNALAVIHAGKRYVFYNPGFISKLTQATGTYWAAVSVLAHEIGHHLYNQNGKGLSSELEADEFSGYILRKLGASLDEAQAAVKLIGNNRASSTHPARDTRLTSIAKGWRNAGESTNTSSVVVNNAVVGSTNRPSFEPDICQDVAIRYNRFGRFMWMHPGIL